MNIVLGLYIIFFLVFSVFMISNARDRFDRLVGIARIIYYLSITFNYTLKETNNETIPSRT